MGNEYADMTDAQLRKELEKRDLDTTGDHDDLVARLVVHDEEAAADGGEADQGEADQGEGETSGGTKPRADRSGQFPGAGDPRETHDPAAGRTEKDANKL